VSYLHDLATPSFPKGNIGGWQERHLAALCSSHPMVIMLRGWAAYADKHRARFESGIGEDSFLGPQWEAVGRALLEMLNGDCGALDCGTIDGFIRDALKAEGFREE
jgi:hypothetical protein